MEGYMSSFLKLVYRYNVIPIKIPADIFFKDQQPILEIYMEIQKPRITKANL